MKKNIIRIVTILVLIGFSANLQAQVPDRSAKFRLSVTSNIRARVLIQPRVRGAAPINGTTNLTANLPRGTYVVEVSAAGYESQRRVVALDRNMSLNFTFQSSQPASPAGARLSITSNVNGARIQISGPKKTAGTAPFAGNLPRGSYTITIAAPGYTTQTQTINLQQNENLHFNLQPPLATIQVIIQPENLNKMVNDPLSMVAIYDNGVLMNGTVFTLQPGRHTIQIVSGGMSTETTFNAEAGRTYTINPYLSINIE